ncbi:hypothetical protein DES41_106144 [Pseudorhodoferax soli]|uniref:Uncharacterized protein n=1 Tax=Pseudorhodoferax soli TaxID=545864 RepID=A0A368XMS2_9BURK|nr:hypothetical protein DES41_106144 [Pseudorhodoferax soli]
MPASLVNQLRLEACERLQAARLSAYQRPQRAAAAEPPTPYPEDTLTYLANVFNDQAEAHAAL